MNIESGIYRFRVSCSHKETKEFAVEYEDEIIKDIEDVNKIKKQIIARYTDYGYEIKNITYKRVP